MLNHLQQISVNYNKILRCERELLFLGSDSDVGPHIDLAILISIK
jgi:hypothetical protein